MCTVTWIHTADGYELLSNRDERKTRPPAEPPHIFEVGGVRVLAPLDGAAGGSWLTVNELGVALCLLNLYEVEVPPELPGGGDYTSRGLLVLRSAGAASAGEAVTAVAAEALALFRPFTLLALDAAGEARLLRWDGEAKSEREVPPGGSAPPLVSSGYDVVGATSARSALLAELEAAAGGRSADLLERFHRSHAPERGPYSPCMHRWDAETVSFSRVTVEAGHAVFRYVAGAPCEGGERFESTLARRSNRDRASFPRSGAPER